MEIGMYIRIYNRVLYSTLLYSTLPYSLMLLFSTSRVLSRVQASFEASSKGGIIIIIVCMYQSTLQVSVVSPV